MHGTCPRKLRDMSTQPTPTQCDQPDIMSKTIHSSEMFILRNSVVLGRTNSGGSPGLCPPPPPDCLFCGLKSVHPLTTEEDVLLGQSLSSDSLPVMTCLSSSPFPNVEDLYDGTLPLAQGFLPRDP